MVGGAYKKGCWYSGFGQIALDNGEVKYVPDEQSNGFYAMLDFADKHGWDTTEKRKEFAEGQVNMTFKLMR